MNSVVSGSYGMPPKYIGSVVNSVTSSDSARPPTATVRNSRPARLRRSAYRPTTLRYTRAGRRQCQTRRPAATNGASSAGTRTNADAHRPAPTFHVLAEHAEIAEEDL